MPIPDAVSTLARDLGEIFGDRLQSVVSYASADCSDRAPAHTLALVESLSADDLRACAEHAAAWHKAGLATPLLLNAREFSRALDAFPFEFGAIIDAHEIVAGANPFEGLRVDVEDLRRACEVQARSHLLHLREGYIETRGQKKALVHLILHSAPPLAALLRNLGRLNGGSPVDGVLARVALLVNTRGLPADEAQRLFPDYLKAVEHLTNTIDRWSAA
jgi:hypothetical protein